MASQAPSSATMLLLLLLLLAASAAPPSACGAGIVGVNWGELGDNLPPPAQVVQLLKAQGIGHVKIFGATPAILQALAGSGITAMVAVANELLEGIAGSTAAAAAWVQQNVQAYPDTLITYVAVGNEVLASRNIYRKSLLPALFNIHTALVAAGLDSRVKVSSPMALNILTTSYPPSRGAFSPYYTTSVFTPLLDFLNRTGAAFIANAYPYFAYIGDPADIPLSYATGQPNPGVIDPNTGLRYDTLLEAQLDAIYSAMAALGFPGVGILVGETGWPSKGDPAELGADLDSASSYNRNLVQFVYSGRGTPLHPNASLDAFLFALFNEDLKRGKTSERNYGLFYPVNQTAVYPIDFRSPAPTPSPAPGSVPPAASYPPPAAASYPPPAAASYPPPPAASYPPPPPAAAAAPPPPVQQPQSPPAAASPPPPAAKGHHPPGQGHHTGDSWCIASPSADPTALQQALDWACGDGGANCQPLQPGQDCFLPNTLQAHANYAFNSYFQIQNRAGGSCYFGATAYITSQDPSYAGCPFPTSA